VALREIFSTPVCSAGTSKSIKKHGKSSRLHSKKNFLNFRPPWPTFPGPGRQSLGGSISLKFLLETRPQSESFDTLDDLLGFGFKSYDVS